MVKYGLKLWKMVPRLRGSSGRLNFGKTIRRGFRQKLYLEVANLGALTYLFSAV